jgi:hypothetical protein
MYPLASMLNHSSKCVPSRCMHCRGLYVHSCIRARLFELVA